MSHRMGMVIGIRRERIAEYKALHANAWPEIVTNLARSNITNYSIFLCEPECLLFSYWEYTGVDFDADMELLASHAVNKKWRSICGPMQIPFESRKPGEWWANMQHVFHAN